MVVTVIKYVHKLFPFAFLDVPFLDVFYVFFDAYMTRQKNFFLFNIKFNNNSVSDLSLFDKHCEWRIAKMFHNDQTWQNYTHIKIGLFKKISGVIICFCKILMYIFVKKK